MTAFPPLLIFAKYLFALSFFRDFAGTEKIEGTSTVLRIEAEKIALEITSGRSKRNSFPFGFSSSTRRLFPASPLVLGLLSSSFLLFIPSHECKKSNPD